MRDFEIAGLAHYGYHINLHRQLIDTIHLQIAFACIYKIGDFFIVDGKCRVDETCRNASSPL